MVTQNQPQVQNPPALVLPYPQVSRGLDNSEQWDANWQTIQRHGPHGGAGHRYATVVVAASNSLHHATADADFICSGTNDDATIQSAINSCAAIGGTFSAPNGKVLLLEGDYNFSTATTGLKGNGVDLEGMNNGLAVVGTNLDVPSISTDNVSILQDFNSVRNVWVNVGSNSGKTIHGINDNGNTNWIDNCFLFARFGNLSATSYAMSVTTFGRARGNYVQSWSIGYRDVAVGHTNIAENVFQDCKVYGAQLNCSHMTLAGNKFYLCNRGIFLLKNGTDSCQDNLILGNHVWDSVNDQITVDGTNNFVTGNLVRKVANSPANGLLVAATATTCIVSNNDLHNAGTANYTDSGVGTITLGGNRTT